MSRNNNVAVAAILRPLGRFSAAAASIAVSFLSIWIIGELTSAYSVHLCGWPASISCDSGARVFWLVPIAAAGVAFAGASLLVAWATNIRGRGWVGMMHSAWAVATVLFVLLSRPRTFGLGELLIGGVWFGIGIELVRLYGLVLLPRRRRGVHVVVTVIWAAFIAVLWSVPSMLEAAMYYD